MNKVDSILGSIGAWWILIYLMASIPNTLSMTLSIINGSSVTLVTMCIVYPFLRQLKEVSQ